MSTEQSIRDQLASDLEIVFRKVAKGPDYLKIVPSLVDLWVSATSLAKLIEGLRTEEKGSLTEAIAELIVNLEVFEQDLPLGQHASEFAWQAVSGEQWVSDPDKLEFVEGLLAHWWAETTSRKEAAQSVLDLREAVKALETQLSDFGLTSLGDESPSSAMQDIQGKVDRMLQTGERLKKLLQAQ